MMTRFILCCMALLVLQGCANGPGKPDKAPDYNYNATPPNDYMYREPSPAELRAAAARVN